MSRPLLLDLYCCAGGAARGYADAGFEVVGVDTKPQPSYPYRFVRADALDYLAGHWREADVFHASAPCQKFSKTRAILRGKGIENNHPDLIEPTRAALRATGRPYVMENVPGCPLVDPIRLCGMMFGLRVYRHHPRGRRGGDGDRLDALSRGAFPGDPAGLHALHRRAVDPAVLPEPDHRLTPATP